METLVLIVILIEFLEALKYPNIIFKSISIENSKETLNIKGVIQFHGIDKNIDVNAELIKNENTTQINGKFNLSLSDFSVDRPSLLLRKVDDQIIIVFKLIFN